MLVTTSGRPSKELIHTAEEIASELEGTFIKRNKKSIAHLKIEYEQDVLMVGKNRIEYHFYGQAQPLFFHPNSAMFRVKRLISGEDDPFCRACSLSPGDAFLDCTLGMASDSIVASYVVGDNGFVQGIEGSRKLAYIVQKGLQQWETGLEPLDHAMKRINVNSANHLSFLQNCQDQSYDVVYFDPMFEITIEDSIGLQPLKNIANYAPLLPEAVVEAKRVARKRVVLKDHWRSDRFEKHGFQVDVRKSAKFHFGIIELQK